MISNNKIFINFSNHPSANWSKEQINEALKYGEIIDIPFPEVDPKLDTEEISQLACEYTKKILEYKPVAVLCQGEMTLSFKVVEKLNQKVYWYLPHALQGKHPMKLWKMVRF